MSGFTCVLLAGGESRRFGENKPGARLPGGRWPFAELVARLRAAGELPALAGSRERSGAAAAALRLPRLEDAARDAGPLAGLAAALGHPGCEDPLLILPCDMVLAPGDLRARFASRLAAGIDAVLLRLDDRPNPVCGLYRRAAAPALAAALAAGTRKLTDALAPLRLASFEPSAETAAVFRSFNTREEFAALTASPPPLK